MTSNTDKDMAFLDGWLVVNKPPNLSSNAALSRVKRALNARHHGIKVGHAGTLDPLARGILPVALGKATKTVAFLMSWPKTYRFTVRWGVCTPSHDLEGPVQAQSTARPQQQAIQQCLAAFVGEIMQVPPAFSALKVKGVRSFTLARAGKDVALKARPVQIKSLKLLAMTDENHSVFEMVCGQGTYVRSVVRDMAKALGVLGTTADLHRTAVGIFDHHGALDLEELEALCSQQPDLSQCQRLGRHIKPLALALRNLPHITISPHEAWRLRHGQSIAVTPAMDLPLPLPPTSPTVASTAVASATSPTLPPPTAPPLKDPVVVTTDSKPVALARYFSGVLKPVRVFC